MLAEGFNTSPMCSCFICCICFGCVLLCICISRCVFWLWNAQSSVRNWVKLRINVLPSLVAWTGSVCVYSLFNGLLLRHSARRAWPRLFQGLVGALRVPTRPCGCPPVASTVTPLLQHLDFAGGKSPVLAVHAPSLLTVIVNNLCMPQTNAFSPVLHKDEDLDSNQNSPDEESQLSAEAVKKLFDNLLHPPALSHSTDPYQAAVHTIWMTLIPTMVCSRAISLSIAFLGTKTVMPDLLTLLPYRLRPWKRYTTSYRKSSCSYVHLLLRTLSRMTFLSWMTSSESTLLSWRLN